MITALLTEALKMRRVPGIVMVDGPTGRRAVVAGSGLDVWEIIATWQACGKDERQLAQNYLNCAHCNVSPEGTRPQLEACHIFPYTTQHRPCVLNDYEDAA